jgi:hypothetical protein
VLATIHAHDREELLGPYLRKLAGLGQHQGQAEFPSRITIGAQSFHVDPWERQAVLRSLESAPFGPQRWYSLLAQGVALQVKALADIEKLTAAKSADNRAVARAELQLDAAIGFALMTELQRTVDQMVVAGEMELANRVTQFRNKLSHGVRALEEFIGRDALDEAEDHAHKLVILPEVPGAKRKEDAPGHTKGQLDLQTLLKLEEDLLRAAAQPALLPAERAAPPPVVSSVLSAGPRLSLRAFLGIVLLSLAAAWYTVVGRRALNRAELPAFSLAEFRSTPQIVQIVSRPPSLFVVLEDKAWRGMSDSQRLELVESVGRRLSAVGYTGAHFSSSAGRTVAQWLRKTGAQLITGRRAPS